VKAASGVHAPVIAAASGRQRSTRSPTVAPVRGTFIAAAALLCTSCAQPPPEPPPAAPVFQPVPRVPQEELSIQARSQPAGPGKQSVAIFVNGERVIDGVLTTQSPRKSFRGKYREHEIHADCVLVAKVDCTITVDGAPESATRAEEP
jgi:hypothetical protein